MRIALALAIILGIGVGCVTTEFLILPVVHLYFDGPKCAPVSGGC